MVVKAMMFMLIGLIAFFVGGPNPLRRFGAAMLFAGGIIIGCFATPSKDAPNGIPAMDSLGTFLGIVGGVLIAVYIFQKWKANKAEGKGILIFFIICIIAVAALTLFMDATSDGSSGGNTNTCKVCDRSWSAGDSGGNYRNIARTGMCNNCESNYHWAEDALGR